MKIVYIDTNLAGHHIPYLQGLVGLADESVAVLPERIPHFAMRQRVCAFPTAPKRKLSDFDRWIRAVKTIVDEEQPDIVHFLMGDDFYRFFGWRLSCFSAYKTIVTLHWLRNGLFGTLSTKCIAGAVDTIVIHSDYLKCKLQSKGVNNAVHVEYPRFQTLAFEPKKAKAYWNLKTDIPVIACLGNTRYDKGIDILLNALSKVKAPFQLLVAGKSAYFDVDFIQKKIAPYRDSVRLHLEYLSDEEMALAVSAADLVVLPYRKVFDGASGPMVDGVALGKVIVGPDHGNLGYTINKNHLGYTFHSEDEVSLAQAIEKALLEPFEKDSVYKAYQQALNLEHFRKGYERVYEKLR